ncbi:uncharacterized protein PRCAT00001477001 [Priceomyces carsonii]|uniref:uncharacterized protein n=1 Tax=Priceomyces carsonii TaxID=28549 RepID=UPI002ED9ECBD|nr:unnamed protein product [Priceomyces carsonii]
MIETFLRDSFVGYLLKKSFNWKHWKYPEEDESYGIPEAYRNYIWSLKGEKPYLDSDENFVNPLESEYIKVSWDNESDPQNPRNWPLIQKWVFVLEILFLTSSVYMASSIYTPGIPELMEDLKIGRVLATLPLTLFVIGYGVGPMILSPMSENAILGRTSIYIITIFVFFILLIPTAFVKNIEGLCILRFLGGFFASPCLATGPASIGDIFSLPYAPMVIGVWSIGVMSAPSLGPLLGAAVTLAGGWRWTFKYILIQTAVACLLLALFLPETSEKTLLHRKAQRLRDLTCDRRFLSEGELELQGLTFIEILIDTLWRPIEITLLEPMVLAINIYLGLIYSIVYLWFEAYPIVFGEMYKFGLVTTGLSYLSIVLGGVFGALIYIPLTYKNFTIPSLKREDISPESVLFVAIIGAVLMPVGIFIFGWTANPHIHWIVPIIGACIYSIGAFLTFQALYQYLSMSFWKYMASAFAGNDLFRSVMAGAFPIFGKPLFSNLSIPEFPVAWGSSLLGFILTGMISIPLLFYFNGLKMRARSKYAS